MIYSADINEITNHIGYIDLCKYLAILGWKKYQGKVRDNISVYQKTINEELYQITVPCSRSLHDYSESMCRAISILAETENKSNEQMVLELLNPVSDVLKFRYINDDVEGGSILIEDAIRLYDNAKKLIANATMDITNYKKIYLGRPNDIVQQFVSQCRFGQTEIGSYAVSLVCPFVDVDKNKKAKMLNIYSERKIIDQSLTRLVTKKVIDSVYILKKTIETGNDLSEVVENDDNRISVSFIESLISLNLANEKSIVEIGTSLSPLSQCNIPLYQNVRISHDYYTPLQSIVDKYKSDSDKELSIVEGKISALSAKPRLEERKNGIAKMVYIAENDSKIKSIQLELNYENYETAILAHKEGRTVRAIGKKSGSKMSEASLEIF